MGLRVNDFVVTIWSKLIRTNNLGMHKSLIVAILTHALLKLSTETIFVMCKTQHAADLFLGILKELAPSKIARDSKSVPSSRWPHGECVICCTTSTAADHISQIQAIPPSILIVQEAGRILNNRLTPFLNFTKHAIPIGDHKHLQLHVSLTLTLETEAEYSQHIPLLERLIRKGHPVTALPKQYQTSLRVSSMTRNLAYPDLVDATSTAKRAYLRGFLCSSITLVLSNVFVARMEQILYHYMLGSDKPAAL